PPWSGPPSTVNVTVLRLAAGASPVTYGIGPAYSGAVAAPSTFVEAYHFDLQPLAATVFVYTGSTGPYPVALPDARPLLVFAEPERGGDRHVTLGTAGEDLTVADAVGIRGQALGAISATVTRIRPTDRPDLAVIPGPSPFTGYATGWPTTTAGTYALDT